MEQPNIFDLQKSEYRPETSLLKKFSEIHNSIYANDGLSAQQALDEMLKILFIKVLAEKENTQDFFVSSEEFAEIKAGKKNKAFSTRIESLFQRTIESFADVFEPSEKIKLSLASLAFAVNKLQNVDFSDTTDAKGLAFQKFLASTEKADRGQFFTPEPVINFCVEFLQPQPHEKIIDPTCGSGGFLFSAYQYLLDNFQTTHSYEIINATSYLVHELPSRASYEVQENDILTAVAGNSIGTNKHATALVTKEYEGSICTNGFRILRNRKIDLYYLLYYLRTEMFLKQVFMYRTGAAIPNISDHDLGRILVYLPEEKVLQEISEKVRYSFELRKQAKEEVEKITVAF
jgi:hypothetical protein